MRLEDRRESETVTSGYDRGYSRARIHQPTKHSCSALCALHDYAIVATFATFADD